MGRQVYNKLVRDKIPEVIVASGAKTKTRILEDDCEYAKALDAKMSEEYQEFLARPSLEELADMQEVLLARADTLGGRKQLEEVRRAKLEARGAFAARIFLESVDE